MSDEPRPPQPSDPAAPDQGEAEAFRDERLQEVHAQLLREKDEPEEGFAPTPMFVVWLFAGMMCWAGIYLAQLTVDFNPYVYDEQASGPPWDPGEGAAAVERPPEPLPVRGAKVYARNCVQCHQTSGQGQVGSFPPLVNSPWVLGSEERLVKLLLHGMSGELVLFGVTYNGQMPGFSQQLSDRDIAAVATYIRQEWGNAAPEIPEEFVVNMRTDTAGRTRAWGVDELLELYPIEEDAPAEPAEVTE